MEVTTQIRAQYDGLLSYTLNSIGSKWDLLTIWFLNHYGTMCFNERKRYLGDVTNFMLTQTLKTLEKCDVIIWVQYNEIPLRVEHSISENGKTLLLLLASAVEWVKAQQRCAEPSLILKKLSDQTADDCDLLLLVNDHRFFCLAKQAIFAVIQDQPV